jgi:translation initiation factor 5A
MMDDGDFETGASGAADSVPIQCSALRKNGYVVIKQKACKIVEMSTSKTGKHGHAKVHLVGIDIFNGKKLEDVCPSTHNMMVPTVVRKEYEVVDIDDDGFFSLMDESGDTRDDLKLTDLASISKVEEVIAMKDKAEKESNVVLATVWKAMGDEIIKEVKIGKPLA